MMMIKYFSFGFFPASTDILKDMVAKLENPRVALVHQMPFTTDQKGLIHAIEKVGAVKIPSRYHLGKWCS